jgi:two-component system, chemotaxis family, sensor kinase CheA
VSAEDDFVEVFRDEAAGRLDAIDELLLRAEAGDTDPDLVDALFREFHTIKGAAGLVGLDDVHGLAHAAEGLLDTVRGRGAPLGAVAQPLFLAAGELRGELSGEPRTRAGLADELDRLRTALAAGAPMPFPETAPAPAETATATATVPGPAEPSTTAVPPSVAPAGPVGGHAIRIPAGKLDRLLDLVGETMLQRRRLVHSIESGPTEITHDLADHLAVGDRLFDELQESAITLRTVPLRTVTGPFPRAVREIALDEEKQVELELLGGETELDRVILERIVDPLVHLLRNAVHHGIESPADREAAGKPAQGRIELRAEQRGALVEITVADDGRGVPAHVIADADQGLALADVLARAGFSTAGEVTGVAGRGVGLDAVKRQVESLGGRLEAYSQPGTGTELSLLVPLTLALLDVLLVERGGQVLALPLASVLEAATADETHELAGRPSLEVRGRVLPMADMADVLGIDAPALAETPPALVTAIATGQAALLCDHLIGEEEVVVRTLGSVLGALRIYMGAAVLGDGRVALIVDPGAIVDMPFARAGREPRAVEAPEPDDPAPPAADEAPATVLVVEDSLTVRALQRSILESAGYEVEVAVDGVEALDLVRRNRAIALVVSDVDMPRMDGIALLEAIRADPDRGVLPVVLVTARAGEHDRRRAMRAGADVYLEKAHFDQQALLGAVERLLGR